MTLAHLPEVEQQKIRDLYASDDRPALKNHIAALRRQHWPLRSIAEALGLSRATVQYWERNADPTSQPEKVPLSPKAIETAGVRTVRWRSHLRQDEAERLAVLAPQAQKVRSQTPEDSPLRDAAALLDALILKAQGRMVAVTEIAQAMGVTHRAVSARLERLHGV